MVLLKRIPTVGFALPLALLHMFYSVLKAHSTPLPERADERLASHESRHDSRRSRRRRVAVDRPTLKPSQHSGHPPARPQPPQAGAVGLALGGGPRFGPCASRMVWGFILSGLGPK
jgi:hypothetical protein